MKKLVILLIIFFGALPPIFAQIVDTAWVRRYDNGGANDIAIDSSSNVYVTGSGTIKYSTNGNLLWIGSYGGNAIAVDASGNVYVTGNIYVGPGQYDYDYITIKYYSNGDTAWVRTYKEPWGGTNVAWDVAVDNSGNVYVTGRSYGDYTTIKYDPQGNELWLRRYVVIFGEALAMALDHSGNIYITGYVVVWDWSGYATVKYDPEGNELWVRRYNNGGATAIAVDDSGNVYVTGESSGDYATIKYDTNGNELWVQRYNGPENEADGTSAIILDNSGNVYVTGSSGTTQWSSDYATIKYDRYGNELWVRRYNNGGATAIAVDDSGNVYVTGESSGDYATIMYDTTGNMIWLRRYDGGYWDDYARAIAVDDSGNAYVTGGSSGDYATIKYFPTRIVGYWKFNEGTDTVAYDSSGYRNDGLLMNGSTWVGGLALLGKALAFDGEDDYVDCGNGPSLNLTGNITISAWVKFDALPDYHQSSFVSKNEGPYARYKWVFAHSRNAGGSVSALTFHINDPYGVGIWLSSLDWTPSIGRWYHVAVVGNAGNYKFYVDGKDWGEDNTAYALPSVNAPVEIGRAEGANNFSGVMDEVKIFGRAYSAEEIKAEFKAGFIRGDANTDGKITVSDVIYLINHLFKGGSVPQPLQAGDVNCSDKVTVSDVVYLINYLFKGGPPPC